MSKRKSQPTKISLTSSDEETVKKNEFKDESDLEDNGVFEDDTAATELNSETDETPDNVEEFKHQLDNRKEQQQQQQQLNFDKQSAILNSLMSSTVQAMNRKHKKLRPSESEENIDGFANNLNNLNSNLNGGNNLSSLMNLAMGNQSAIDLFALNLQSIDNGDQFLSTMARLSNPNALNDQQSKDNQQTPKTNNGIFRRRKRSEIEDDEELDLSKDDLKANLNATLLEIANNQTVNSLSNDTIAHQLSNMRKQQSDNDTKQDAERKVLELIKQINELKEKINQQTEVQQNGNSLVNGSTFNSPLNMVSGYLFLCFEVFLL